MVNVKKSCLGCVPWSFNPEARFSNTHAHMIAQNIVTGPVRFTAEQTQFAVAILQTLESGREITFADWKALERIGDLHSSKGRT